jgi:hypothetical protein
MGRVYLAGVLLCALFLFSCQTVRFIGREPVVSEDVCCTIIYVIHGDGEYLYHDAGGKAHRADDEALKEAVSVAERSSCAEVFIFHQKKRPFLFPVNDGRLYLFRSGRVVLKASYSRSAAKSSREHAVVTRHQVTDTPIQGTPAPGTPVPGARNHTSIGLHSRGPVAFEAEASLYRRYASDSIDHPIFFLYYGHQIPEFDGRKYHASYPRRSFTIHEFAGGLKRFLAPAEGKFDLVLLSTCFSGTPGVISAVGPHTRYVIASPENLHLSYISSALFRKLDWLETKDLQGFFLQVASDAFEELKKNTQTEITVVLYDIEKISLFLGKAEERYRSLLKGLSSPDAPGKPEPFDCAEDPVFRDMKMAEGVEIFYSPPRFGKKREKRSHSGWECWRAR